ncbi:MAG: NAD(P)/FAD-dependent oxidoreductase [Oscillospiraceae bacterium]|nr:NAD(P)/FAD-dependent oxidoreductase [Oscillospiraceae bacterium]
MGSLKYPHLFEPLVLRGVFFRNRIFAAPTGYQNMTGDGVLPPEAADYYARKAKGGAASVASCEFIVDGEFGSVSRDRAVWADNVNAFMPMCRIANAVSRFGAVPTAELSHTGMYANRKVNFYGGQITGRAFGPVETEMAGRLVEAMPAEMIEKTIEKFAEAAVTAKNAGFRMVLVHAGHGWLLHQFVSPRLNTRKDKWGGPDIENRARFTVAVCDAIRKAVGPGMPIEVRISGSECYDEGYGIEEGIAFAEQLDGKCDLIQVSVGNHEAGDAFTVTHPRMFLGDGCNVKYAAEIKKHVKTPVAAIGALGEPEMLEEIIASGKADVVEMARSLIADPDLPNKIMAGKEDEIRWCMRCLLCFTNELALGEKYCAVNPESGYEHKTRFDPPPARVRKKILIAGGGIAGIEAAVRCARQGHKVILCEKNPELGGNILCEKYVPFKRKLGMYLENQIKAAERAGVDIRVNTEVTQKYAAAENADVIIAALGAAPVKPPVKGMDGKNVMSAEYAYLNAGETGKTVAILGAGLVGLELALYLAGMGKKVRVLEMLGQINDGGNSLHGDGLMIELKNHGVELSFNTRAIEITKSGVLCDGETGESFTEAETVVYAAGRKPLRDEAVALRFAAPEFYILGDCITPGNIAAATSTAYETALNTGRF